MGILCCVLELIMILSVISGLALICVAGANWQSTYGPRVVRRQPVVVVDDLRHGGNDRFSSWDDDHFDGHRSRPVVVDDWRHGHDGSSSWDDDHYDRPSHWEDRRVIRHRSRAPVRGAGRARFPVLHGVRHRPGTGY